MGMHIGERIRRLRRDRDWTQENLAEKLNLSVAYISKIETGRSDPDSSLLKKIAEALEVQIQTLFDDEKDPMILRAQENQTRYDTHTALNRVPFLGRIYANPQGVEYFDDDVAPDATVPYFRRNRCFALEIDSHSLMDAEPIPVMPGDICVFEIEKEPRVGDVVAVQLEQSNGRMAKILHKVAVDTVELRSANRYVQHQNIILKKDEIVSFAVMVGKLTLVDEEKRRYGLKK